MNIEQIKLDLELKTTPWDGIKEKAEKYSYTPSKASTPEELAAAHFSAALSKAFSGQAITTTQSDLKVYYLNEKIFVRLDIFENTLGSPRREKSALFVSFTSSKSPSPKQKLPPFNV